MSKIITISNVSHRFNSFEMALNGVTLDIERGKFHVILGQSGSGKSTLINIMSSLLQPTCGAVFYDGKDITKLTKKEQLALRRNKFSNIFQEFFLLSELTVKENVELGNFSLDTQISYQEIMQQLDIAHLESRYPYELSGGQRQRVSIARAIIKNPEILFCDEATGALDEENSKNVVSYLKEINIKYGTTLVFSTHNIKISKMADRIITMKDGMLVSNIPNTIPTLVFNIDWGI